jgi:hypothetical protein
VTQRIRAFLLVQAAAFAAAALVHSGLLVHGYEHRQARVAESVIALRPAPQRARHHRPRSIDEEER